jgi:hypothetical protein
MTNQSVSVSANRSQGESGVSRRSVRTDECECNCRVFGASPSGRRRSHTRRHRASAARRPAHQSKKDLEAICARSDHNMDEEISAVLDRLGSLMQPIFARTASTPDGLAVQAAAAVAACRDLWDMPADTKCPCDVERDFIEAVCRHTGVEHPTINAKLWRPSDDASVPEPDQIYAAIEAQRVAYAAWEKALKLNDGGGSPSASIYLRQALVGALDEYDANGDLVLRYRRTGKMKSIYASCSGQIKRDAPGNLEGSERDAWIEKKCAELQAEEKRLHDEFVQTPEGKLWLAERATSSVELKAQDELFDTTSTTIQGLLALLALHSDRPLPEPGPIRECHEPFGTM